MGDGSEVWAFSKESDLDDVMRMLTEWRANRQTSPQTSYPQPKSESWQPKLVVLLDDLRRGQTVQALVLEPRYTLNQTQVITAVGDPSGGYMRWGFKPPGQSEPQWTPNIYPLVDKPDVIQRYLGSLRNLTIRDVSVTLGLTDTGAVPDVVTHNPWRWQVTFGGQYSGTVLPPLAIDAHLIGGWCIVESDTTWEQTGQIIEVSEVIGVPNPTPAKRGARAWVQYKTSAGWCVVAIEPRDFGDYGLFGGA